MSNTRILKLANSLKPLHDGDITRGPYPVKSKEVRDILKKFTIYKIERSKKKAK